MRLSGGENGRDGLWGWGWSRGGGLGNPHALGGSCDEFSDGVGEGGGGMDMEDGDRVLAVVCAALHEDDGYEVGAGGLEEGEGAGLGEVLDVGGGDVADDVEAVVDDGEGGEAFGTHEEEGFGEGFVAAGGVSICSHGVWRGYLLDSDDLMSPDLQIPQDLRIQSLNNREAIPILPQKVQQLKLTQHPHNILCTLLHNNDPMYTPSKELQRR